MRLGRSGSVAATGRRVLAKARRTRPESLLAFAAAATLAYLIAVPIAYLVWHTFLPEGHPTLAAFREAYSVFGLRRMVTTSLLFAVGSTALAVVSGTALAYLVARTDLPGRPFVFAASIAPLAIPGVLYTIAWIFVGSPRSGVLNQVLDPLFGQGTFDIFSLSGMIFIEGLHLTPFVFLFMFAAFRSLDPSLEESALVSGARLRTVFRRITLRVTAPALSAAVLITAIRALEAFEVPALIGIPGGVWVFTSRIWRALSAYPADLGQAGAYALPLLALTAVAVFIHSRVAHGERRFQTIIGKGPRPRPLALGRWRWPFFTVVAVYIAVTLLVPLLALVFVSFERFYEPPSFGSFSHLTLDNYAAALGSERTLSAVENSLLLSAGTATLVMLAMTVVAWIVLRSKVKGRWLLDGLASLPIAIPGLVLGLALLFVYLRLPVGVYGTLWILLIGWMTHAMPYGMRYASVSMGQLGRELEESAHVSGADWWQTFRRVLLPLLLPGLLAGWLAVLIVSIRELSTSIVLYSPGNEVLSVLIWTKYQDGQLPEVAAIGVAMVLSLGLLTALLYRFAVRLGVMEA